MGINSLALKLHRYAYNGFYKDASDYYDRRDAIEDLVVLIRKLAQLIAELGREKEADGIMKRLGSITTQYMWSLMITRECLNIVRDHECAI